MKFTSFLVALAFAGRATAQSQCAAAASAVPSCGESCLNSAAQTNAGCTTGNGYYACQCSSSQSAVIQSAAINCVISACGIDTALIVQSSAQAVCSCVASLPASQTPASSTLASSTASPASSPTFNAPSFTTMASIIQSILPSNTPCQFSGSQSASIQSAAQGCIASTKRARSYSEILSSIRLHRSADSG